MRKYAEVATAKLKPYQNNAKIHDKANVEKIAASIREFGFINPVLIDETNQIIAGHGRVLAAESLGLNEVPCIYVEDLTETQKRAYILADNKLTEDAEWDENKVKQELEWLDGMNFDIELTGFTADDFKFCQDEIKFDDDDLPEIEEPPEEPDSKPGQLYKLGRHRLLIGDSTKQDDVARLMAGARVDLLLTDPPYNVAYEGKTADKMTIENDEMDEASFYDFLSAAFRNAAEALEPGAAFYVFHADSMTAIFRKACDDCGLTVHEGLVWVKHHFTFGRQDYKWKHEPILYGWKEGASHYFKPEYNHTTVFEDPTTIDEMDADELRKALREILEGAEPSTVIHEDRPMVNADHPTMKPVKLCARLMRNSTEPGDKVLDMFGGSGSTLIAAELMGRSCYAMELEPKYADVIIKRWQDLTGEPAELIEG